MPTVPNPAVTADVEASFERPLTPGESTVVQNWLDQSWTILAATVPGVAARLQAGTVDVTTVVQVLVAMVERKLRNPNGLRSWDADNYTETVDQALSSGQLYPTADEVARLAEQVAVPRGTGMFFIPLG